MFLWVSTLKKLCNEAPTLMKYREIIQNLAGRGPNWRFYCKNFHFLRWAHCTALSWDWFHGQVWLKSQVTLWRPSQLTHALPLKGKADIIPKGYCFRFHMECKCLPDCVYRHLCYKCKGFHPNAKCNFHAPLKTSSYQASICQVPALKSPRFTCIHIGCKLTCEVL